MFIDTTLLHRSTKSCLLRCGKNLANSNGDTLRVRVLNIPTDYSKSLCLTNLHRFSMLKSYQIRYYLIRLPILPSMLMISYFGTFFDEPKSIIIE